MITRRQALVVRGSFRNIPDYLHEELESHTISSPNVKSYPFSSPDSLGQNLVRKLDEVVKGSEQGPSIAHSPCSRFRGELQRNDFCVVEHEDGNLDLLSSLWKQDARPVVKSIPRSRWTGIVKGLNQWLDRSEPDDRTFRGAKRLFTRAINQTEPTDTSPRSDQWIDETELFETILSDTVRFPAMPINDGETRFLVVTFPAGVLSARHLKTVLDVATMGEGTELYLTPEQNILIPLPGQTINQARSRLMGELGDSTVGYPLRVATCPGSQFCTSAALNPVSDVRRLSEFLLEFSELSEFNRGHPIGISGCGETRALERLHPVGLAPSEAQPGYDLYMGGTLHGNGRKGIFLEGGILSDQLCERIEQYVTGFRDSEYNTLIDWVKTL